MTSLGRLSVSSITKAMTGMRTSAAVRTNGATTRPSRREGGVITTTIGAGTRIAVGTTIIAGRNMVLDEPPIIRDPDLVWRVSAAQPIISFGR
jgi:hypothetical protein